MTSITALFNTPVVPPADLTVAKAAAAACWAVGCSLAEIRCARKEARYVRDRWLVILILYNWKLLSPSMTELGRALRRDHTSICYAVQKGRKRLADDEKFATLYHQAWDRLKATLDPRYFQGGNDMRIVRPIWTPEEEALLEGGRANFSTKQIEALAKITNRTPGAIINRMNRLAAVNKTRSDRFEKLMERRCMGCDGFFDTRDVNKFGCGDCPSPRRSSRDTERREAAIGLS